MATVTSTNLHSHPDLIAGANGAVKSKGKAARRPIRKSRALGAPAPLPVPQQKREMALEREQLLEHARALLDPLASLEMLCEADEKMDNVIFYMNRCATETMNLQHGRLNPMLHGADVRAALAPLHPPFHKDPERIRNIFRALVAGSEKQHNTELTLGGITFALSFTPVWSRDGKVHGLSRFLAQHQRRQTGRAGHHRHGQRRCRQRRFPDGRRPRDRLCHERGGRHAQRSGAVRL